MIRLHRSGIWVMLLVVLAFSLAAAPVAAAKLATPVLVSPATNQHFHDLPGYVTYAWKPVTGADQYECQVQWNNAGVWENLVIAPLFGRFSYSHSVTVNREYRWRVTAYDNSHVKEPSNPSTWRTFDITLNNLKLATPQLVSPASGVTLYATTPPRELTCIWNPVLGSDSYVLDIQRYDTATHSWIDVHNALVGLDTWCAYQWFGFPTTGQGRWRVTATSSRWQNSNPSSWRTFTFV